MHVHPVRRPQPENSYWFLGGPISVLVSGEETNGTYALLQGVARKGEGPPPHIHHREDEVFYMIDGELTVFLGDQQVSAKQGDTVFLPKGIQHTFRTKTETATLQMLSAPAGFEKFMRELALPYDMQPSPPDRAMIKRMIQVGEKYGIEFPTLKRWVIGYIV